MEKTRDLLKKTGDIKGKVHVKMGTIKDRNDMILRKGGKNTQKNYIKKILMIQITTMV